MDQPHLHRLPELSRWGNVLSLTRSCLTVGTENSAWLELASCPWSSLEPLPSHHSPPALPLPPQAGVPSTSPPRHSYQGQRAGATQIQHQNGLSLPHPLPAIPWGGEKGDLTQGWGTTGDFPALSQPILSSHGRLISQLTVLGVCVEKPSSYFI